MHCLWCDQEIIIEVDWNTLFMPEPERIVCKLCEKKLEILAGKQCEHCGRLSTIDVCGDCQRWEQDPKWAGVLTFNQSVYVYNDQLKEVIAKWKYRGDYVLRDMFREQFRTRFKQLFAKKGAVLVPIPLSEERLQERGFNQAEALVQLLERPYHDVLTRVHGEKQSKKTRIDRLTSANPFELKQEMSEPVILIDDIYTTGVTLRHAAKKLKEGGCPEVFAYTLARG